MTTATERFFEELGRRGYEPRLSTTSGRVRCDLIRGEETDHWLTRISGGHVEVSRVDAKADGVIRADEAVFDGIATGEMNLTTAFLRGDALVEGDYELVCLFERLFPGPPDDRSGVRSGGAGGASRE